MNEAQYMNKLIKRIAIIFPDCIIIRNDPRYIQGVPDILILYHGMLGTSGQGITLLPSWHEYSSTAIKCLKLTSN